MRREYLLGSLLANRKDTHLITALDEASRKITTGHPTFYAIKKIMEPNLQPGVYLFKKRTRTEHELHRVFDGSRWYFGASGVKGAIQCAERGAEWGEFNDHQITEFLRMEKISMAYAKRIERLTKVANKYKF